MLPGDPSRVRIHEEHIRQIDVLGIVYGRRPDGLGLVRSRCAVGVCENPSTTRSSGVRRDCPASMSTSHNQLTRLTISAFRLEVAEFNTEIGL